MATVYVWQKYGSKTVYTSPTWPTSPTSGYNNITTAPSGYTSYSLDTTTGIYSYAGYQNSAGAVNSTTYIISADGKSVSRYVTTNVQIAGPTLTYYTGYIYTISATLTTSVDMTQNLGLVRSTNRNEYPDVPSTPHTDGYYYLYVTSETAPDIQAYVNIGGAAKEVSAIYVNIGGTAKEVSDIYVNIDGTAKHYY